MSKAASLITGISGQDGAYLAKFLLDKSYEVFGTYRRLSTPNFWRLQYLGIFERVNLIPADLVDAGSMVEAVKISEPDEIYHLAAQSFVGRVENREFEGFISPIIVSETLFNFISESEIDECYKAIKDYALLTNDAFHVATMKGHGINKHSNQ